MPRIVIYTSLTCAVLAGFFYVLSSGGQATDSDDQAQSAPTFNVQRFNVQRFNAQRLNAPRAPGDQPDRGSSLSSSNQEPYAESNQPSSIADSDHLRETVSHEKVQPPNDIGLPLDADHAELLAYKGEPLEIGEFIDADHPDYYRYLESDGEVIEIGEPIDADHIDLF